MSSNKVYIVRVYNYFTKTEYIGLSSNVRLARQLAVRLIKFSCHSRVKYNTFDDKSALGIIKYAKRCHMCDTQIDTVDVDSQQWKFYAINDLTKE